MDSIFGTWQWYVAGPIIGLFVPVLLIVGNKLLGISSSFLHVCSLVIPGDPVKKLGYDIKKNGWKFQFVIGIAIGAFIAVHFLSNTKIAFLPESSSTTGGLIHLFIGGLFVGFGTRYANGCTSGHSITGISLLHWPSVKATIAFFVGGLVYTYGSMYLF